MIGNQRLEHSGEPRGRSFGSDTLGGYAGALAQQENLVGETLGIGELSIAAQANKPFAERGFILADDTPRRMILVRQLDRSVGECTPALVGLLEVTDMPHPGQEQAFRIACVGGDERVPSSVEFLRERGETRSYQHILRGEVTIERHLVGAGRLGDSVNTDGMDTATMEQLAGGGENALARGRAAALRDPCGSERWRSG